MGIPRFLTGILAAPLLLSACGGGGDSVADPPVSPSSTSSSTATPQRESPEDFIRRFVSVSNTREMRGNTDTYLALTSRCTPCRALAEQIGRARSNGGYYHSQGWSITSIKSDVNRE